MTSQELPPESGWGGIGTYVATLGPALARRGAEIHVLSVVPGQAAGDDERDGMLVHRRPLRRVRGVGRLTRLPEAVERVALAAAVARETRGLSVDFDVIEAPEWRAEGLALAPRRRAALVVRLHSAAAQLFPLSGRTGPDARAAAWLESRTLSHADLIVSTGANLATLPPDAGALGTARRVIALPVAEAGQPVAPGAASGTAVDDPRIVFVGRLERRKGPETIVEAAARILRDVPRARFELVGADTGWRDGTYGGELRARAVALGVEGSVELAGHLGRDQVRERLRRAAVCVFPSRQETFGYGAAEAAALGRAVVASDIPSYRELFGADGARLVPATDAREWATAVTGLLRDPAAAERLARAGRARVAARCHPDAIAGQTLDAYEEARRRFAARRGGVR